MPDFAAIAAAKANLNRLPIDGPVEVDKTFEDPEDVPVKEPGSLEVIEIGSAAPEVVSRRSDARHTIQRLPAGVNGIFTKPAGAPVQQCPIPAPPVAPKPAPQPPVTRTPVVQSAPVVSTPARKVAAEALKLATEPIIALLPPLEAAKRRVCLLLPTYKSVHPATLMSIVGNWDRNTMGVFINMGNALIAEARNQLADTFLRSKFEWALWVDDDMVLPVGNAGLFRRHTGWTEFPDDLAGMVAINRLLSHGKTVVGAVCSGRLPWSRITFSGAARDPETAKRVRSLSGRGLEATDWIGTGVLLTHRSVFEDIRAHFPHLAPIGSPGKPGYWRFFTPVADGAYKTLELIEKASDIEEIRYLAGQFRVAEPVQHGNTGEDIIFCHRALQSGHQPYADLGLICGHVGQQVFGPMNTSG